MKGLKDAYDKSIPEIKWRASQNTSHKGYDNPVMMDIVVDKYFEMKEKELEKYVKGDWRLQDIPHTVKNEIRKDYYTSDVINSHQYPKEINIFAPTLSEEIPPPKFSQVQKNEDNEPFYIGMRKYTRKTLPNKMIPLIH
jgi:hypothetical protein